MQSRTECDLAIVGGGLAGGLIALALKAYRPDLDVRLVESGAQLGGNDVVRLAGWIARAPDLSSAALCERTHAYSQVQWRRRSYYRMRDKMLFWAGDSNQRYRVLERFYTLAPDLIRRANAGESSLTDKLRILTGKPSVSIPRAIGAILGRKT